MLDHYVDDIMSVARNEQDVARTLEAPVRNSPNGGQE